MTIIGKEATVKLTLDGEDASLVEGMCIYSIGNIDEKATTYDNTCHGPSKYKKTEKGLITQSDITITVNYKDVETTVSLRRALASSKHCNLTLIIPTSDTTADQLTTQVDVIGLSTAVPKEDVIRQTITLGRFGADEEWTVITLPVEGGA